MNPSAPPRERLASVYQPDDPIQTLLNCYVLCESSFDRFFNLLQDEGRDLQYCESTRAFAELVDNAAPELQIQDRLDALDDDDALIQCGALLTALSRRVARDFGQELGRYSRPYRSSAAFGDAPYWLSVRQRGLAHRSLGRQPRKELHSTIRRFHEPLVVIPAAVNQFSLVRITANIGLDNLLAQRADEGRHRIAVGPLSYEADLRGTSAQHEHRTLPDGFHLTAVEPLAVQEAALTEVLRLAYDSGISILVLPELRMPPALVTATQRFLREQELGPDRGLLLVAAGSWHIERDGVHVNRCTVLDHIGDVLWTHDKLREFEVTPENVAADPGLFAQIGVGEKGGFEAIARGEKLEFFESVLGRLAAAICIGFFSPEVAPLLQASRADIFLVPTMTPSVLDLERCADTLVRTQHAFTFAANCGRVGRNASSFCRWPAARDSLGRLPIGKRLLALDLSNISMYALD